MNELYIKAELEIVEFTADDIINTSSAFYTTANPSCPTQQPVGGDFL